jgi:hypothetical protein
LNVVKRESAAAAGTLPAPREAKLAAPEVDGIAARPRHGRIQGVDAAAAPALADDEGQAPEDLEVMGNVGDPHAEGAGEVGDIHRPRPEAAHDPESLGIGEGLEEAGAAARLQWVAHDRS